MGEQLENLKNKTVSGIMWKGFERIAAQLVSAIVSIVLARILIPDDYSVVSVVTIFFAFCNIFISGGLNAALVQKKGADIIDFSTILIANLFMACILYIIMFFCAPFIARLYNKELLVPVIRIMSLSFFINGYKSVICAKITANLQFKKFFWSTIIGTIVSAAVGITMALKGFGPWALVAQQMTNSFIDSLVLTFTSKIRFVFKFSGKKFKQLFKFGGKIMLSSVISEAYTQVKPLIVGIKFSPVDLAYYNKGMAYPNLITSIANETLSSSLFPAMSIVQDDKERILNMTRRFMQLSSFFVFPMMIGFLVLADNFVQIVLTEKWLPIVPYLMIVCVSDMLKPLQTGNLQAIRAIGRSDIILILEIIKKTLYAIIILLFVFFTDTPVLLALSGILTSLLASLINAFPNKKLIGYGYGKQFHDLFLNLFFAILMGVGVYLMRYIPLNLYALTIIQIISGILFYFGINLLFKNKSLLYFLDTIKGFLKMKNIRKKIKQIAIRILPKNCILFESYPTFSDNTKAVFDEMVKRNLNKKYKFIWVMNRDDEEIPKVNVKGVKFIKHSDKKFFYYLCKAKALVCCNGFLTAIEGSSAKSFYLSHGTPIKNTNSYYKIPNTLDYVITLSQEGKEIRSTKSGVDSHKIAPLGFPRNDVLTEKAIDLHECFSTDFKKIIVWYPTFRQGKVQRHGTNNAIPIIWDENNANILNEFAKSKQVLIVLKAHHAQNTSYIKKYNLSNIVFTEDSFFTENNISSYRFVAGCDALLTDYSSIYFDYLLCDKPIGLVWEDYDEYEKYPGFVVDMKKMMAGGSKIYNVNDFISFIEMVSRGEDYLSKERELIKNLVHDFTDGKSSVRVVDFIIDKGEL